MASYRVYWVDPKHRIRRGAWIEAADDADARRQAEHLCDGESASIELWQASRQVADVDCGEAA